MYADAKVAATTVTGVRSSVRLVGLELSDASIRRTVLSQGKPYAGAVTLASVPYYGAFVPVFAVDETAAGMLFVGKPQTTVLDAAATSIQETMIVVLVCMVLSLGPAYLIARSIGSQVG